MTFSSLSKRTSRGFGLLEVILVFAIVIGAAAIVFTVFQSAKPSADASNEGSNISTIATNLKSTFGINHDYSGVTTASAIQAKAIPAPMVSGTSINSQWGTVTLTGQNSTSPSTFDINYAAVPADTCAKLVTGVAGFFDNINIDTAPIAKSASNPNVLDNTAIITACSSNSTASTHSIDFIGH